MNRAHAIGLISLAALSSAALAAPQVGRPAPDFALPSSAGKTVKLSDFRGKTVVLEWNNPGCPYVQKHYGSGSMQQTQAIARQAGVVWISINSSAPGKQGYMTAPQAAGFVRSAKATVAAYLLDHKGTVGRLYSASTTPEMFIVDPAGTLVYRGGIDDKPTANPADLAVARNYVRTALAELKAGKPVSQAETRTYGCSVKYAS